MTAVGWWVTYCNRRVSWADKTLFRYLINATTEDRDFQIKEKDVRTRLGEGKKEKTASINKSMGEAVKKGLVHRFRKGSVRTRLIKVAKEVVYPNGLFVIDDGDSEEIT